MPPPGGASRWSRCNAWLYRVGHAARRARGLGALVRRLPLAATPASGPPAMLYVANGRLGDSLLAAAFTRHYREWFGLPIVAVARPETEVVLGPQVDRFLPFDPARLRASVAERRRLAAALAVPFRLVLGDVHLAYGGEELAALVDAVPADHRLVYQGLPWPAAVLPHPSLPRRAEVVPTLSPSSPGHGHVWHHLRHFHQRVLDQLARPAALPEALAPPPVAATGSAAGYPLPRHWIAVQATSAQPKKDWPWAAWCEVFAAFPDATFVLLGHRPAAARPVPSGVIDLRGRTTVAQALTLATQATAFVGVDSALTHAAAIAGRPTVCVMASAWPQLFFPYPAELQRPDLQVVRDPRFLDCAGCGGLCHRAPLWRTHASGWPCLARLGADLVVAALRRALATADARSAPAEVTGCTPAGRC